MGRKQKLRQERKIRNKAAAGAVVTTTSEATVEATSEGMLSEEATRLARMKEIDSVFIPNSTRNQNHCANSFHSKELMPPLPWTASTASPSSSSVFFIHPLIPPCCVGIAPP